MKIIEAISERALMVMSFLNGVLFGCGLTVAFLHLTSSGVDMSIKDVVFYICVAGFVAGVIWAWWKDGQ